MIHVALAILLLAAPAAAQRGPTPFDGDWGGTRTHECRTGGRISIERLTMEVRRGEATVPALLGDPELSARVQPGGTLTLPAFGLFGPAEGRFEGNRFTARHVNRSGNCSMRYELQRVGRGAGR
jgi:hypothetical protein